MAKLADLHTHSRYSDGTSTPAEVVRRARKKGVEILVLTDHDSVAGFPEARDEASRSGLRIGCGIEINTREPEQVHILGYGIDPGSPILAERLADYRERREQRAILIVERLRRRGIEITIEEVRGTSRETLGRPHVADALRRKKIVHSRGEAFERYLSPGAAAYVEPMGPGVEEAIDTIRRAGGWASLAHPLTIPKSADIGAWVELGLEGLEAHYSTHTRPQIGRLVELANRYGLHATGGSDYHGPGTGRDVPGGVAFSDEEFAKFEGRLGLI